MRVHKLLIALTILAGSLGVGVLQAGPANDDDPKPAPAFKPLDIQGELRANDALDPQLNQPAKRFTVNLHKDRTYIIDLVSRDFDTYLRLLDKDGKQLEEDDDAAGGTNARIIYSAQRDGAFQVVASTFDGEVGRFVLRVRQFIIKGEAKPRNLAPGGLKLSSSIDQGDVSYLGKVGKLFSFNLKAGHHYTIDLESRTMDSFLLLFDEQSKLLAQNDDNGDGDEVHSRITFRAERDGVYHIFATSLDGNEMGDFTLRVRRTSAIAADRPDIR